jgi:hypothetical protein
MPDTVQLVQSLVSGGLVVDLIYGLVAIGCCVIRIKAHANLIAAYLGTEAAHA